MRLSRYFLPTLKEVPAEAEVISQVLMLRAAMIRKLAAGIYSYLPYGLAAFRRVEQIIREEMNRAGAIEMFMPEVQPAELWIASGRWEYYGKELLRFKDRHAHDYCLAPTNEEVITDICRREIRSYRDMPLNLYHFQQKYRDEVRPRFGVMRGRQFCMKDAYSFDVDEEGCAESYRSMHQAYCRSFDRMGLKYKVVEADTGAIGGSFSHEFMVLAETGEDAVVSCAKCDFGANIERAEILIPAPGSPAEAEKPMNKVLTPEVHTVEELCAFLDIRPQAVVKTLLFITDRGPVAALIRGDHEANEVKIKRAFGAETIDMASPEEVRRLSRAPVGFAGPVALATEVKVLADLSLKGMTNWVTGANEADHHLINVNPGRDFPGPDYVDLRLVTAADPCPRCGAPLEFLRGIEVGHIFKLGTKYSEALEATFLDGQGQQRHVIMGCYGIGVDRTLAAAIEQNHDEDGIIFPAPLAPFTAVVVPVGQEAAVNQTAEKIHQALLDLNVAALLDDRDVRPGVKFKDADLIGVPYRLTVGRALKDNQVEIKPRRAKESRLTPVAEAASTTAAMICEVMIP